MKNFRINLIYVILGVVILSLGLALIHSYFLATEEIKVYFSDSQGQYLMTESRGIRKYNLPEGAVEELISGPTAKEASITIPEGVELLGLEIEAGRAEVDFSQEIVDDHWGGSAGEMMTVYSIVNTLTQFSEIDEVLILVEGEVRESLAGHLDLSKPLKFNSNLIN